MSLKISLFLKFCDSIFKEPWCPLKYLPKYSNFLKLTYWTIIYIKLPSME